MKRVLFVGDVAIGTGESFAVDFLPDVDCMVANLEGPLVDGGDPAVPAVWNDEAAALTSLRAWNVRAVSLANNHAFDLGPEVVAQTRSSLCRVDIEPFGLRSASPTTCLRGLGSDAAVQLVGAGWGLIGCYRGRRGDGIVDIGRPDIALSELMGLVSHESPWIAYLHWGYEYEQYPQPAHRSFARQLIEAGASAVVGTHSHIVQGVESWRGRPIVYGLGNWAFSEHYFYRGALAFPPHSSLQLAFEWNWGGEHLLHWYRKSGSRLIYEGTEALDGPRVRELTPFLGMGDAQYSEWFRKHRARKELFLPAMQVTDGRGLRVAKESMVKVRQTTARVLKHGF